jgi:hypothetical protein
LKTFSMVYIQHRYSVQCTTNSDGTIPLIQLLLKAGGDCHQLSSWRDSSQRLELPAKMRPKGPSEGDAKNWDAIYKELEAYHKKHGHSNVPSTLKNKLSRWVGNQRKDRPNEEVRMTAERTARLDKLDFRWATRRKETAKSQRMGDERWREMYEKLKAYNEKHGHCRVPIQANAKDSDTSVLGPWVSQQRQISDRILQSRKDLLDELDFLWLADNWDTMYEQLVKFRQEYCHTEVPGNNTSLAEWCRKQRAKMRHNKLPPERRDRMEEIGFNFELQSEKNERIWNAKLQRLREYKLKHGNCLVPLKSASNHVEDEELSMWVSRHRNGYKRGTIPNHRIQALEEVGFVWSIVERGSQALSEKQESAWEKSYENEVHGHFTVPHVLKNRNINPLNSWIAIQRKYYAQGQINEDRRLKLEAIDFVWDQGIEHHSQRKWNAAFQDLIKFREENGHTFVRRDDGMALWRWTEKMNWKRKRSTLSLEREERLESIGFWDPPPAGYQKRGKNNEKSEDEDKEFWSSEDDDDVDDRRPVAKRRRTTSTSEEEDNEFLSNEADDDRKPTAKRRRSEKFLTSEADDDLKPTAKRRRSEKFLTSEADDDRKPTAKRRRTISTSEEEDTEFVSSEADDDRKPTAERRRTEEFLSSKADDDHKPTAKRRQTEKFLTGEADDDRKPTAKRRQTEKFLTGQADDDRKPTAKRRRTMSTSEEEDNEFLFSEADDHRLTAKRRRPTAAEATAKYEEEACISRSPFTRYSTGTKGKKFFEGHGWFLGEITLIDEEYCCYVRYEDGDEENYLLDELEDLDKIFANVARTHPRK